MMVFPLCSQSLCEHPLLGAQRMVYWFGVKTRIGSIRDLKPYKPNLMTNRPKTIQNIPYHGGLEKHCVRKTSPNRFKILMNCWSRIGITSDWHWWHLLTTPTRHVPTMLTLITQEHNKCSFILSTHKTWKTVRPKPPPLCVSSRVQILSSHVHTSPHRA